MGWLRFCAWIEVSEWEPERAALYFILIN
jgi:hypothetical protein